MTAKALPDLGLALLELLMLVTAFRLTTYTAVKGVIATYQWQSYLLALITGATAFKRLVEGGQGIGVVFVLIVLIVLLPAFLGWSIEYLLARATVIVPGLRIRLTPVERRTAEYIWLQQKGQEQPFAAIFFVGLLALAGGIAFLAIPSASKDFEPPAQIGLMVSLSLHLIGLYNTATKHDIISQVIGLLTMDHGLYLAIVKIVAIPVPATFFVLGLYAYTLITIIILVLIVPQVRHEAKTVDLKEIVRTSELEG